jgi:hypothetical protein
MHSFSSSSSIFCPFSKDENEDDDEENLETENARDWSAARGYDGQQGTGINSAMPPRVHPKLVGADL